MIKQHIIKKSLISFAVIFALLLMYLIPKQDSTLSNIKQELYYVDSSIDTETVYLLNNNNMLSRTIIAIDKKDIESKAKEMIEILIKNNKEEDKIPNGFKSLLPSNTKIINIEYKNEVIKINFSKELLNVKKEDEEKVIESIIYTLTSVEGVKKVIIYVDNKILTKLPKTKINLPSTLDRSYGINKQYSISDYKNINKVTIYYLDKYNDNYYYVPVTKYLNDSREKIKIIIEELSNIPIYNSELMSFLNSNTELLNIKQENDSIFINFNKFIFSDLDERNILEEVIYSISLSVGDNYNLKEVVFEYNNKEIYKSVIKTIE